MSAPRIAVLAAGVSQPSSSRLLADRLADATVRTLGGTAEARVVELRDTARDAAVAAIGGIPTPALAAALRTVTEADAVIAVTPVFNASMSGVFKTFLDVVEPGALEDVPVLIGATGGSERHSLVLDHAMRPLFSYLRAAVLPTGVYAASADWGASAAPGIATLGDRIERAGASLARVLAPVRGRAPARRAAEGDAPVSIEALLRAAG